MSYAYSTIALALSLWSISIHGLSGTTSLFGKGGETEFKAAMAVFQAFGNVACEIGMHAAHPSIILCCKSFVTCISEGYLRVSKHSMHSPHSSADAWSCAALILSIQSTLKEPPQAVKSMAKTINTSFSTTVLFYLSVACTGYAALGASVPGDVLTGFNVSDEVEVIANITVLLHMIAVVQVYTQVSNQPVDLGPWTFRSAWSLICFMLFMNASFCNCFPPLNLSLSLRLLSMA